MSRHAAGVGLAEMLVALVLTGVVLSAVAGVLRHALRLATVQREHLASAEAERTVRLVLQGELRYLDDADLVAEPESLGLRAIRGLALVCGGSALRPVVRVRGLRLPDADKDSVMAPEADPSAAAALVSAAPVSADQCSGVGVDRVFRLELDRSLPGPLLLYFERGSYHLSGHAFRYRRGRAGRQPLTTSILETPAFVIRRDTTGATLDVRALRRAAAPDAGFAIAAVPLLNAAAARAGPGTPP